MWSGLPNYLLDDKSMSNFRIRTFEQSLSWLLPLSIVIVWELLFRAGLLTPRLLPAPSAVAQAFWIALLDGSLIHHTLVSTGRAIKGLVIGSVLGLAFGFANGLWRKSEITFDTTLQMLRNVPHLAIIPLVILWFGIDEGAKTFLVSIGVLFPIYINTYHGVRNVEPTLVEMGRVYGLSQTALFWRIALPGALPSILVGFRYALGIMWLTLIVAETISASSGLGYMTMNAREFLQTDIVLLGIIIYALLGKLADWLTRLAEHRLLAWHPAYQTAKAA
jgi:sulfonate transport system permease protein